MKDTGTATHSNRSSVKYLKNCISSILTNFLSIFSFYIPYGNIGQTSVEKNVNQYCKLILDFLCSRHIICYINLSFSNVFFFFSRGIYMSIDTHIYIYIYNIYVHNKNICYIYIIYICQFQESVFSCAG